MQTRVIQWHYKEIIKDPLLVALIVAVFSSLVALIVAVFSSLLALFLAHLYGRWQHRSRRGSGLAILRHQLENHEDQLKELRANLTANGICSGLDPSSIVSFINGDISDLSKDEKLISALYKHMDNIRIIDRVLDLISMRAAGFTNVQEDQKTELEGNLKKAMDECLNDLQSCLDLV